MSYPGPCPEGPSAFGVEDYAQCVESVGGEVVRRLFNVWLPDRTIAERGPARQCVRGVWRRAARMVLKDLRARARCFLEIERSGTGSSVDCLGQPQPYGSGTFDDRLDDKIFRAYRAWQSGMPRACVAADFPSIGYGADCENASETGATLLQFHACVFRHNRAQIPALLDLVFPSDPVCGNGILQEGEACDNGAANSDQAPNACRLDCSLPVCGDGTADPAYGETCDDGNFQPLDGCNATCGLEFCGDGTINDLPNEVCDDGNQNPNDRCTGTCQVAACGDGVVCSDAACTSGPGGGPEFCDQGAANSPSGLCDVDCSGFSRSCTLRIGVTTTANLGALTYEVQYRDADGEFVGTGGQVACRSLVTGGLVSFFDDETKRTVKESLILASGFQAPLDVAECDYVTNDFGLSAGDFPIRVLGASTPDFDPVDAEMVVTSIVCEP